MPDYQGNSKRQRDKEKETDPNLPPKNVERVIVSDVIVHKKGIGRKFKDIFIEADFRTVAKHVVMAVLIPAAKDMMMDALSKGGAYMFYGDRGPRGRYGPPSPRITYNSYSSPINRGYPDPRESSMRYAPVPSPEPRTAVRYSRSEFILSSREEAELVLENMTNILESYDVVSVADLNDLVGLPTTHVDNKWGWSRLNNVQIRQIREGYIIEFPPAEPIG